MLLFMTPALVMAQAIGLPENTARIGIGGGAARMTVDDPDGPTATDYATQPLTLIYTDWFFGRSRLWSELYYNQARLAATSTRIGQEVQHYGYRASVQWPLGLDGPLHLWFGGGVDLSRAQYTLRHTVDQDGFLANRYADRDTFEAGLLLNINSEWALRQNWSVGAKIEQLVPVAGNVDELTGLITILYRY